MFAAAFSVIVFQDRAERGTDRREGDAWKVRTRYDRYELPNNPLLCGEAVKYIWHSTGLRSNPSAGFGPASTRTHIYRYGDDMRFYG
jgi:hypothetical protein